MTVIHSSIPRRIYQIKTARPTALHSPQRGFVNEKHFTESTGKEGCVDIPNQFCFIFDYVSYINLWKKMPQISDNLDCFWLYEKGYKKTCKHLV